MSDGSVEACKVACVLGARSRVLKAFEGGQENPQYTLPMISITRSGIKRDPTRLSNLHNEVKHSTGTAINYDLFTPNPINIEYKVTVYAKYTADIDMIISNFLVFFNNDIYVSSIHPKYKDMRYYSQVIMGDSISETRNETIANTANDFMVAELSFTFKTFVFGGNRAVSSRPYLASRPITSVTEITACNDDGDPILDDDGKPTIITTQITGVKDEIYEGFIPLINAIHLELHAVPRYDPFKWRTDGVRINYDFKQYFTDVDNKDPDANDGRMLEVDEGADYDSLDWIIDTVFENEEEEEDED